MDIDDPWDWSVDRVVQEFCTSNRSWQLRSSSMQMPEPVALEHAIREQAITGSVLLIDIDDRAIREDLRVTKLGWRSLIRCGIEELRQKSQKYIAWYAHRTGHDNLSSPHPSLHSFQNIPPQLSPRPTLISPLHSSNTSNLRTGHSPHPIQNTSEIPRDNGAENPFNGEPATKKQKLISPPNNSEVLFSSDMPNNQALDQDHATNGVSDLAPPDKRPEVQIVEHNGKKRKRIAPELVSSDIDPSRSRQIPTEADLVIYNNPDNIESNVPAKQPSEMTELQLPGESMAVGYLGGKKIPVDKIFYGDIPVGSKLPQLESFEFSEAQKDISSGRRLYVNNIMKHFLQVNLKTVTREDKQSLAYLPYSARFTKKSEKPSFTLFKPTGTEISVTRENLSAWPEIDPEAPRKAVGVASSRGNVITFNFLDERMADVTNAYDNPDTLQKYQMVEGSDAELPLYGDSDFEYSESYWDAIEAENESEAELEQLPPKAIQKVIDDVIDEMITKWNQEKLPKREAKAWRLWRKVQRSGVTRRLQIEQAQRDLDHLNDDRIPKLRRDIALNKWESERAVRKQIRIMEPTIFDREDLEYTLSVLRSKVAPEKPLPSARPMPKKTSIADDYSDDGVSIHSESSTSEQVDDDIAEAMELNLADDEDDATMSDASHVRTMQKAVVVNNMSCSLHQDHDQDNTMEDPAPSVLDDDNYLGSPELMSPFEASTPARLKQDPSLPHLPTATPENSSNIIDLTLLSSDDGPRVINLITPKKNRIRIVNRNSSPLNKPIRISDSDEIELPDPNNRPPLSDPVAISRFQYSTWQDLVDRDRLLIKTVQSLENSERQLLFRYLLSVDDRHALWAGMMQSFENSRGMDEEMSRFFTILVKLFEIYVDCKYYPMQRELTHDIIRKLETVKPLTFKEFHKLSLQLKAYFSHQTFKLRWKVPTPEKVATSNIASSSKDLSSPNKTTPTADEDEDSEPLSSVRHIPRESTTSEDDPPQAGSPSKKRKKKIFEDASARDLREQNRERLAQQEQRRRVLQLKLAQSGDVGDVDRDRIIINDGKFEDQGYIYINDEIGKRIKPHQIEGVKFMWNQVVLADTTTMQGCLLAHTMGLGKTMQSITLLVAIAEAAASPDPTVVDQIPDCLRVSKTLILCPPGLIGNWEDELLMWAGNILGEVQKIDSSVTLPGRMRIIKNWSEEGGVLVIGYQMFRNLTSERKKEGSLSDERYEDMERRLVESPNIIIADEAHMLKNPKSAISVAASRFRSQSRIALTGSPLANNVVEYHTMIEWIAPNYLGPAAEFRCKYVDPIEAGLYIDSTANERRKSLKMLRVLNEDLSPKVNRADMSVLRDDLPKKEFVITVTLTELQKQAYSVYVRSMIPGAKKDIKQTTIWHWISILTLIVNHPSCFMAKLRERKEDAQKESQGLKEPESPTISDPTEDEDSGATNPEVDPELWKVGVSENLITQESKVFQNVPDLDDICLSNKVLILTKILDESKHAGDKVLVFSHSLDTLDYLENTCIKQKRKYARLDGKTNVNKRQTTTKEFNTNDTELYLISTSAGGLGLNLYGANRVVIFDFRFNPIVEEQAIGRAYRIGQKKPVFVYRLIAGGTFEMSVHNKSIYKTQLASRVVDKKNPLAYAKKNYGEFLFEPRELEQKDLNEFKGMDPGVLDSLLEVDKGTRIISEIVQSDAFDRDDPDRIVLTAEEELEEKELIKEGQLKRSNPDEYRKLEERRRMAAIHTQRVALVNAQRTPFLSNAAAQTAPVSSVPLSASPAVRSPAAADLDGNEPPNRLSMDEPSANAPKEGQGSHGTLPDTALTRVSKGTPNRSVSPGVCSTKPQPLLPKSKDITAPVVASDLPDQTVATSNSNGLNNSATLPEERSRTFNPTSVGQQDFSNNNNSKGVKACNSLNTTNKLAATEEEKYEARKILLGIILDVAKQLKDIPNSSQHAFTIGNRLVGSLTQSIDPGSGLSLTSAINAASGVLKADHSKCERLLRNQLMANNFAQEIIKQSDNTSESSSTANSRLSMDPIKNVGNWHSPHTFELSNIPQNDHGVAARAGTENSIAACFGEERVSNMQDHSHEQEKQQIAEVGISNDSSAAVPNSSSDEATTQDSTITQRILSWLPSSSKG